MVSFTGFWVSNIDVLSADFLKQQSDRSGDIKIPGYKVLWKTSRKFPEDKVFEQDDRYITLLDGIILNFTELKEKYRADSMYELCIKLFELNGETFHSEFIGNFAGAFYIKKTDTWIIFANKYASKSLFYYTRDSKFIVAPLITSIVDVLKQSDTPFSFNRDAAYLMMGYGFMGTDDTFVREIKRLEAGHYLKIVSGKAQVERYHRFHNHAYDLSKVSEEEIIQGIDIRFRRAIAREYRKDVEQGYKTQLRTLSGGMDSRAAAFVSDSLGYRNVVNFTFGQPGQADEQTAREISQFLSNELIFMSTSGEYGHYNFLRQIDQAVYLNQGLGYYLETAMGLARKIQLAEASFGLQHAATFSEAFLTTGYLKEPNMEPPTRPLHTYCNKLLDKMPLEHLKQYENEDIYSIYSIFLDKHYPTGRNLVENDMTLVFPGLDPDLVAYCLSIPIELRKHYHIYYKWCFTKYPAAARFKLEKLNAKIHDGKLRKYWGQVTRYGSPLQYLRCSKRPVPTRIRQTFELEKRIKPSPISLNPFDYWYENDKASSHYMDDYFKTHLDLPVIDQELRDDLANVYRNDTARPKSMAITVLAAAKMFFE